MPFSDPTDRHSKFISYDEYLKQLAEFEAAAWNKAYGEAMDRGEANPLPYAEQAARLAHAEWDAKHTIRA